MNIALLDSQGIYTLFVWIHVLAGIFWIGLLYFLNLINGDYMNSLQGQAKAAAQTTLLPRVLFYFRWAAMVTFVAGVVLLGLRGSAVTQGPWGIQISVGALLGTIMFLNVWLVIWPNQKIVIASAEGVLKGGQPAPEAAAAAAKAGLASRHNFLFSVPLVFFMVSARLLPVAVKGTSNGLVWAIILIIVGLLELNALKGKMGPLGKPRGAAHMGVLLWAVLYGIIEVLA